MLPSSGGHFPAKITRFFPSGIKAARTRAIESLARINREQSFHQELRRDTDDADYYAIRQLLNRRVDAHLESPTWRNGNYRSFDSISHGFPQNGPLLISHSMKRERRGSHLRILHTGEQPVWTNDRMNETRNSLPERKARDKISRIRRCYNKWSSQRNMLAGHCNSSNLGYRCADGEHPYLCKKLLLLWTRTRFVSREQFCVTATSTCRETILNATNDCSTLINESCHRDAGLVLLCLSGRASFIREDRSSEKIDSERTWTSRVSARFSMRHVCEPHNPVGH